MSAAVSDYISANNAPYCDAAPDLKFSRALSLNAAPEDREPMVTDVAVVGALFDGQFRIFQDDVTTILRAVGALQKAGVPLAPLLHFHFYNLLAPLKNDFLRAALWRKTAPPAQALITLSVFGSGNPDLDIRLFRREQRDVPYENFDRPYQVLYRDLDKGFRDNREIAISSFQAAPESWPKAADAIGAKFVVAQGPAHDLDAVNSNHFLPGDFYKAVIPSRENFEPCGNYVPGPLGILVHRDAIEELRPLANPDHLLGQRLRDCAL